MRNVALLAARAVVSLLTAACWAALAPTSPAAPGDPFTPQPNTWCPGRMGPMGFENVQWDPNVCHVWYTVPSGTGKVMVLDRDGNPMNVGILADVPAPTLTPPPPPPPHPFCSPRGALIIIPPICDTIGVDIPPGSVGRYQ